jgi:hypothetical protein
MVDQDLSLRRSGLAESTGRKRQLSAAKDCQAFSQQLAAEQGLKSGEANTKIIQ